jgi:hypothetical protein
MDLDDERGKHDGPVQFVLDLRIPTTELGVVLTHSLSLKCFYYLNHNQNPKNKGIQNESEFKGLRLYLLSLALAVSIHNKLQKVLNNPPPHVDRGTGLWSSDLLFWYTTPPLCHDRRSLEWWSAQISVTQV